MNRNSYSENDRRPECRAIMHRAEKRSEIENKSRDRTSRSENIARRQLKASANESRVEVLVGNEYINHDYCEVAFFLTLDAGRWIGEGTKEGGGGGYTKR